jgi:hypothetical protein
MHTDDTQEPQDFPVEARKLEGTVQELTAITPSWSASVSVSSPEGQYWDASVGAPENLPSTPADLGRAVYSAAVAVAGGVPGVPAGRVGVGCR